MGRIRAEFCRISRLGWICLYFLTQMSPFLFLCFVWAMCPFPQVSWLSKEWAKRAALPSHVVTMLDNFPNNLHPMSQLSAAITALNSESNFARAYAEGINRTKYWEVGNFGVVIGVWWGFREQNVKEEKQHRIFRKIYSWVMPETYLTIFLLWLTFYLWVYGACFLSPKLLVCFRWYRCKKEVIIL